MIWKSNWLSVNQSNSGRTPGAARENLPLVGGIADDYYKQLKVTQRAFPNDEVAARQHAWEPLDDLHGGRADYRLLRHAFRKSDIVPQLFGTAAEAAAQGLSDTSPAIIWGTLALLPSMATSQQNAISAEDSERLLSWAALDLEPLAVAPKSCAIVRLLFQAARDRTHEKRGATPSSLAEAEHLVALAEQTLKQVAYQWRPGRAISIDRDALGRETKLLPGSLTDLSRRIATAIFTIRGSVRDTCIIVPWSASVDQLLRRVAPLVFSVWRTQRAAREQPPRHLTGDRIEAYREKAISQELKALERACQAARDAGEYTTAAKLAATLLFLVPEGNESSYRDIANRLANPIRELGYIVDSRFVVRGKERAPMNEPSEASIPKPPAAVNEQSGQLSQHVAPKRKRPLAEKSRHGDPFVRRLDFDVENDGDWKRFLDAAPASELLPSDRLGDFIFSGSAATHADGVVEAAFRLSCRYRRLRQAARLLNEIARPTAQLLDFARALEAGMRSAPLCLHTPTYTAWQGVLRRAWGRVPAEMRIPDGDLLLLHEVLLGRGITLANALPQSQGDALRRKLQGEVGDDTIAELLDEDVRHLSGSLADRDGVMTRVRDALRTRPGVALASLAMVGERGDELSLFFMAPDGRTMPDRIRLPGAQFIEEAKKFAGLRAPHPRIAFPQVPGLFAIARIITAWVEDCAKSANWLILCVEPDLAQVPWQALLQRLGCALTVSLVPSFGWLARRMAPVEDSAPIAGSGGVRLPQDEAAFSTLPSGLPHLLLADLLKCFRDDAGKLRRLYPETFFVLGHGEWDENLRRTVLQTAVSPPNATSPLDEVLALAQARSVVLHACYGGFSIGGRLGDLGGLAGLCLAARGRLFLGALTQVSPRVARVLHWHLVSAADGASLGALYRAAIREDERVAQYALFGLPWETGKTPPLPR